jgi:mono/diheme cytochrome c family protein
VTPITAAFRLIVETYISAAGNAVNRYTLIHEVAVVVKTTTRYFRPPLSLRQLNFLRGNAIMKTTKIAALVLTIAVALFVLIPNLAWAEDGAGLYKANCAACHGADAAGKPAMKAPALTGKDEAAVTKGITETAKHPAKVKGLSADDAKAIATYLKGLK